MSSTFKDITLTLLLTLAVTIAYYWYLFALQRHNIHPILSSVKLLFSLDLDSNCNWVTYYCLWKKTIITLFGKQFLIEVITFSESKLWISNCCKCKLKWIFQIAFFSLQLPLIPLLITCRNPLTYFDSWMLTLMLQHGILCLFNYCRCFVQIYKYCLQMTRALEMIVNIRSNGKVFQVCFNNIWCFFIHISSATAHPLVILFTVFCQTSPPPPRLLQLNYFSSSLSSICTSATCIFIFSLLVPRTVRWNLFSFNFTWLTGNRSVTWFAFWSNFCYHSFNLIIASVQGNIICIQMEYIGKINIKQQSSKHRALWYTWFSFSPRTIKTIHFDPYACNFTNRSS